MRDLLRLDSKDACMSNRHASARWLTSYRLQCQVRKLFRIKPLALHQTMCGETL